MNRPDNEQDIQYAKVDYSADLTPAKIKFLQQVTRKFLFYARAVDNTMMHALDGIASGANVTSLKPHMQISFSGQHCQKHNSTAPY